MFFVLLLNFIGVFSRLDNGLYDFLLRTKESIVQPKVSSKLVAVDLTDNSEIVAKNDIENRQIFLDSMLVVKKAGIPAGFDFLFSDEKVESIDNKMSQAASEMHGCVFGIAPLSADETKYSGTDMTERETSALQKSVWHPVVKNAGTILSAARFLVPYDALVQNAPCLAHIGIEAEQDGVQKKMPLLYKWSGGYVPCYAL